jgi:hypothetical protein
MKLREKRCLNFFVFFASSPPASLQPARYTMPGLKWASEDELLFLNTKVESFLSIHSGGKARVRNPDKAIFLHQVYDEYEELFEGRIASMDLPGCGMGGSEVERKDSMLEVSSH